MKAMAHYPDDVWIVGSFRTGNIWVSQIVKLIRNNGVQDDTRITTAVPWPECSEDTSDVPLDQLPRSRTFRSHFPCDKFPRGPPHSLPAKFIYVMRNPKDRVVSYYHVCKTAFWKDLEWDKNFKAVLSGKLAPYGDYFDHILSWWEC